MLAFAPVNPEDAENLDAKISAVLTAFGAVADPLANTVPGGYAGNTAGWVLGQLLAKPITYSGPVNPVTGTVTLIRGDDYYTADGRAIVFSLPVGGGIPNLTGAMVSATWYKAGSEASALSVPGTVANAGTANQSVTVQLSAAQTATLTDGTYQLVVRAALASGHTDTLARQGCTMQDPAG